MDVLEDLFHGRICPADDMEYSAAYNGIHDEIFKLEQQIKKALKADNDTLELYGKIMDLQNQLEVECGRICFQYGFRLAVRLMLSPYDEQA